ncbi:MAG: DUF58 domain-containing protein [Verrucomicrobiota bacterium]
MNDPVPEFATSPGGTGPAPAELVHAPPGSVPPLMAKRPAVPPLLPAARRRRLTLLSPAELERFGNLLVFARSTVEGYFAGRHKSPFRGTSVEFTDYKEYVPGDDPRRIDWRVYGRSRRLYVRQHEAETDMTIYLMVDVSGSMNYAGGDAQSKYVLAARIAAALAYLVIHQGDKAALALFGERLQQYLPPGGTRRHLHQLVHELEFAVPAFGTGIATAVTECSLLFKKRGRIVLLSDFWDPPGPMLEALSRFVHRRYEILLLHVLHPHEVDLPSIPSARFHDMETHEEVEAEPAEIRAAYRELARQRSDALARETNGRRIHYARVDTRRPYLDAIEAFLGFRGMNTLSAR